MKLSLGLFLLAGFQAFASATYSQSAEVTVKMENVQVKDVLRDIEKSSEFFFVYNNDLVDVERVVNVDFEGQAIEVILDELFGNAKVGYSIMDRQIVLFPEDLFPDEVSPADMQGENVSQQQEKTVTGVVRDQDGEPIPGVTVIVKGTTEGTITDVDGNFSIEVEDENAVLVFSFVGMETQEIPVGDKREISVTLQESTQVLDDVVVVGYGVQKKESVVGSITGTTGEELEKAGGVTNVGEALQGRLPGVTTIFSDGTPGDNDPRIYIRGQSSWSGSGEPLILVDGTERSMRDVDLNSIEDISVLKDASATAVFGVKGANGVILITTKRGEEGKPQLSFSANSTLKTYSKLPDKLDSYDGTMVANESILREVMHEESSWNDYVPMEIADKYRNPANEEESYIYPNVNWRDMVLKDFAMDHRVNFSVRGGSDFAQYFGSLSYQAENDLFNGAAYPNDKGYMGEFKYDRFNFRSNLDFNISNTTTFSVNLSGIYGIQERPTGNDGMRTILSSIYHLAPSVYTPVYPDGYYGLHPSQDWALSNPIVTLTNTGYNTYNKFQVYSDFELKQELGFITEGLSFKGKLSYDNDMRSIQELNDPAIDNQDNLFYRIYDIDGNETIVNPSGENDFAFVKQPWYVDPMNVQDYTRTRRLNYELSLNYSRTFAARHNTTALFLFKREEFARGNMFPRFREDWVGRLTYDFDSRYFLDVNGAYNGSEKFGPGYRFELFPSAAVGWMASNETFLENVDWLDKLKIRGSYGIIGDDGFSGRWKYMSQWGSGGYAYLNSSDYGDQSPYLWYGEEVVGNPDLQWETAVKSNIGLELALLRSMFTLDIDYFREDRDNIFIPGSQRSVPEFYGNEPPDANTGAVEVRGYELVLGFNHRFDNGIGLRTNFSLTDARDEVISREDPELRPSYQKDEGYPIGQSRSAIAGDVLTSWDDIYMATPRTNDQTYRRPGYYDLVDFDIDGTYDSNYDNAPYGYPVRPQRTWTASAVTNYKGFSLTAQFYGTQNATRIYDTRAFVRETRLYFEHRLGYWSADNPTGNMTLDPWTLSQAADEPYRNLYDASMVRLKTLELAYDVPESFCDRLGVSGLRVFANGNNLYLWTDLPDDREFNDDEIEASHRRGNYPTMKRFNFGIDLKF